MTMQIRKHIPMIECDGALSDLILQAARQAIPKHVGQLITLPDVGRSNQPPAIAGGTARCGAGDCCGGGRQRLG